MIQDSGEVVSKSENESDGGEMLELIDASDDDDVEYLMKVESLIIRHNLSTQMSVDDIKLQRENIFHTSCIMNNKVCSMVIDYESCINIASTALIEKLGLLLLTHLRTYRLHWLKDYGEVKVNK